MWTRTPPPPPWPMGQNIRASDRARVTFTPPHTVGGVYAFALFLMTISLWVLAVILTLFGLCRGAR